MNLKDKKVHKLCKLVKTNLQYNNNKKILKNRNNKQKPQSKNTKMK